jgi:membrane protease YdiL (CAAX protease family)
MDVSSPNTLLVATVYASLGLVGLGVASRLYAAWRAGRLRPSLDENHWERRSPPLALAVALTALMALTFALTSLLRAWDVFPAKSSGWILGQSLFLHGGGILLTGMLLRATRRTWDDVFGLAWRRAPRGLRDGAVAYIAGLPLIWIASLVFLALLALFGYRAGFQSLIMQLSDDMTWSLKLALLGMGVLVAPLFEEILFRGLLLPLAARQIPFPWAVGFISFFFAAIHGHLPSFMPIFTLSMVLCWTYRFTGTLWSPIALHALFNGVNIGMMHCLR